VFDCAYCVNRVSSNVPRARFTVDEVVTLTLDFYKRNYIEGLFLSSGIIRNGDYTMEQLVEVARKLREEHRFGGYIHLKSIPDASSELLAAAGRYADRLSINVELASETALAELAPEKKMPRIRAAMGELTWRIDEAKEARATRSATNAPKATKPPRFAPAGQSTQMIVGADATSDRDILGTSANLYGNYRLRRVYYSAFSPIPDASSKLPLQAPPLQREHRLYQADWLLRFYEFGLDEIAPGDARMLELDIDPKLAWALRNPDAFPVDLNSAPRERLLRVPGLGTRNVKRVL
jgi:putative DNA modification/repair radical SAM protein